MQIDDEDKRLAEIKVVFSMFDKNGNGRISKQELDDLLASIGQSATDSLLQDIIGEVDGDGGGEGRQRRGEGGDGRQRRGPPPVVRTSDKAKLLLVCELRCGMPPLGGAAASGTATRSAPPCGPGRQSLLR